MNELDAIACRVLKIAMVAVLAWLPVGPAAGDGTMPVDRGNADYTRSVQSYRVPDVTLRNRRDEAVNLRELIADGRPVLLQFIFTSCQTVCPMLTATMAQAQDGLRAARADTRIISISIDPDYDTPDRLAKYAVKHGARGDWIFLTGDRQVVRKTLKAFDAMYEGGNKMFHKPYTFIHDGAGGRWVRLIGLMGASRLVAEYRRFLDEKAVPAATPGS